MSMQEVFGEVISTYSSDEACNDGVLIDLRPIIGHKDIFNYVTNNLMGQGYLKQNEANQDYIDRANLVDLLQQARKIVKNRSKNFMQMDTFFAGRIELPNGKRTKIFIVQNETGKYTLMLPEDY